ncbi:hypothetical protein HU200_013055 [Digitaria exilis]|uniref:Uncharacterized protein n=1 Tax=Digitaria exilis TaxID=1010633 RepID=A0A835EMS8_9POAL|nr:hypothetical protein HU200_034411 [Digitaria exilis]KAF8748113.1 hypothetical protein HU200_013055 [Digitaria exilis]
MTSFLPGGGKFHMVGLAAVVWSIWKARNNNCFENKKIRSPTEIICIVSSFVSYWADLQQALKKTALQFHPQQSPPADNGMVLLH